MIYILYVLFIVIGIVLLLFLRNLFINYKAYFSGGNLKVCAYSVKYLTDTVSNNYSEGYILRISTILKQCKNKTYLKKVEISKAIPQIANYTDLAIFEFFLQF